MITEIDVAYNAFIDEVDHNIESAGPSEGLLSAIEGGDINQVMTEIRAMALRAGRKARDLWSGSPPGTVLFNDEQQWSAQRGVRPSGKPVWMLSDNLGNHWEVYDPVLEPKGKWRCVVDPNKTNEDANG